MKKPLIILIVAGFLLITTGTVGGIINANNGEVGVESTVDNYEYPNRRTSNQKIGMTRGSNYRNNQCTYLNKVRIP